MYLSPMQLTFTESPLTVYPAFLRVLGGEASLPPVPLHITFLGAGWEAETMVWDAAGRHDMFRLAWLKRKLNMTAEYGMTRADAYEDPPNTGGVVKRFGLPVGVRVSF